MANAARYASVHQLPFGLPSRLSVSQVDSSDAGSSIHSTSALARVRFTTSHASSALRTSTLMTTLFVMSRNNDICVTRQCTQLSRSLFWNQSSARLWWTCVAASKASHQLTSNKSDFTQLLRGRVDDVAWRANDQWKASNRTRAQTRIAAPLCRFRRRTATLAQARAEEGDQLFLLWLRQLLRGGFDFCEGAHGRDISTMVRFAASVPHARVGTEAVRSSFPQPTSAPFSARKIERQMTHARRGR